MPNRKEKLKPLEDPMPCKSLKRLLVIGVNSRGNIRDLSLLSSTFLPNFQNWAKAYTISNNVDICGINKDCDADEPEPEPDPDDEFDCIEERYNVWKYGNLLEQWKIKLEQCNKNDVLLLLPHFDM